MRFADKKSVRKVASDHPQPLPASDDILPTQEGYDRWAEIYDDEDNALIAIEEPLLDGLLGDITGLDVIDVGCGTGRQTFRMLAAGANITAVDFSQGMLDKARQKPDADKIKFIVHDLAKPLPFPDASFDRVVCPLVLDHIHDLDPLFAEFARLCRPTSFACLSIMHPAMMLRGVQARFTDPETGKKTYPESAPNEISHYVLAAVRAGLTIDHMSEHAIDDEVIARSPKSEKYKGWPILLMMRLLPR